MSIEAFCFCFFLGGGHIVHSKLKDDVKHVLRYWHLKFMSFDALSGYLSCKWSLSKLFLGFAFLTGYFGKCGFVTSFRPSLYMNQCFGKYHKSMHTSLSIKGPLVISHCRRGLQHWSKISEARKWYTLKRNWLASKSIIKHTNYNDNV